jgi:DNA helicase-2/ATP-dependent DNA helicase PcrA
MSLDLRLLNPAQLEAVKTAEGPTLIIAGPGTGKTFTLAYRIAYLLETKRTAPPSILALTFTNKAAQEMHERISTLLGGASNSSNLWVGTFHALGLTILREQGHRIGVGADFGVLSEYEQAEVIKDIFPDILPKEPRSQAKKWARYISEHKVSKSTVPPKKEGAFPVPEALIDSYEKRLTELNVIDFDDLILKPLMLFREIPQIQSRYQDRFQYFLVDEYQDVDNSQYQLLRELCGSTANVWVIGDADQAIYAFRGANVEHFLRFQQDNPAARVITLETNYRSSSTILRGAQAVIAKNTQRIPHRLTSSNPAGPPLYLLRASDHKAESRFVVKEIEKLIGGVRMESSFGDGESFGFGEIAILYRLHHLAHPLCEFLEQSGIPYQVVGKQSSDLDSGWEHLIPYLKISINPHDELSLCHVLSLREKRLFPAHTLSRLMISAREAKCSLHAFLQSPAPENLLEPKQMAAAAKLFALLRRFQKEARSVTLKHLITNICQELKIPTEGRDAYSLEWLVEQFQEGVAYQAAPRFLECVALMKEGETYNPKAEAVTLMTVHAAKGLEFPVVFMVALESGIFPCTQFGDVSADVEEERRLFYVGMTRAKKRLYLSSCRSRYLFGEQRKSAPSPLLSEIPRELSEAVPDFTTSKASKKSKKTKQHSLFF